MLKKSLFGLLIVGVLLVVALVWEPATFKLFSLLAQTPDPNFDALILTGPESGYALDFEEFPDLCALQINGKGDGKLFREEAVYHVGSFEIANGNALHTVSYDSEKELKYNNVALFCPLPHPENGNALTIKSPLTVEGLGGTAGFCVEDPFVNKDGEINPKGFHSVCLAFGGYNIHAPMYTGVHLNELYGWAPVQGQRVDTPEFSGNYAIQIDFVSDEVQVARLFLDGEEVAALTLKHPFKGELQSQHWIDNYELLFVPLTTRFENILFGFPETLEYGGIEVSVEPIK